MPHAPRVCSTPDCPTIVTSGHCSEHARPGPRRRGYDRAHDKTRARLMQSVDGTACARCGKPMHTGEALHLDHDDSRVGYLGMSHARCNTSAGGRAAHSR